MLLKLSSQYQSSTIKLLREMAAQSPTYAKFAFDEDKVVQVYDACMNHPDWFARITLNADAEVDGVFAGMVTPMLFSHDLMACDIGFFVRAETNFRTAKARKLVDAFSSWATEKNAKLITIGVTIGIDNVGADALLRVVGYAQKGAYYIKQGVE